MMNGQVVATPATSDLCSSPDLNVIAIIPELLVKKSSTRTVRLHESFYTFTADTTECGFIILAELLLLYKMMPVQVNMSRYSID